MMDDTGDLEHLTLPLDDPNGMSAMTLTTLLNSGVEEALSSLSPAQLIQLEKNVQKLKKEKNPVSAATPGSERRVRKSPSAPSSVKRNRYDEDDIIDNEDMLDTPRQRATGGQYLNLPASTPMVEVRDGTEYLIFTYSTKGVVQEYTIRSDIDGIRTEDIPDEFKQENCVYPRALCSKENYVGNRWEYETICNDLAWRLCWVNPTLLGSKRGLIQRAVDSYRNRYAESRSRRVIRQEKLMNGTLRRRTIDSDDSMDSFRTSTPKMLTFQWSNKGVPTKCRIRIDIENCDLDGLSEEFRQINAIYPHALTDKDSYTGTRWEYEKAYNELAWKLAYLNPHKLDQKAVLQKAVDAYRSKFDDKTMKRNARDSLSPNDIDFTHGLDFEGKNEFSEMVASTLQQAFSDRDLAQAGVVGDLGRAHMTLEEQLAHHESALQDLHPRGQSYDL